MVGGGGGGGGHLKCSISAITKISPINCIKVNGCTYRGSNSTFCIPFQ